MARIDPRNGSDPTDQLPAVRSARSAFDAAVAKHKQLTRANKPASLLPTLVATERSLDNAKSEEKAAKKQARKKTATASDRDRLREAKAAVPQRRGPYHSAKRDYNNAVKEIEQAAKQVTKTQNALHKARRKAEAAARKQPKKKG